MKPHYSLPTRKNRGVVVSPQHRYKWQHRVSGRGLQSRAGNDSPWLVQCCWAACLWAAYAVPGLCGQALRVSVLPSDSVHGERLRRCLGARVPVRAHGHHLHRQPVHHHRARHRRRRRRGLRRGRVWRVKHHCFALLCFANISDMFIVTQEQLRQHFVMLWSRTVWLYPKPMVFCWSSP